MDSHSHVIYAYLYETLNKIDVVYIKCNYRKTTEIGDSDEFIDLSDDVKMKTIHAHKLLDHKFQLRLSPDRKFAEKLINHPTLLNASPNTYYCSHMYGTYFTKM